MENTDYLLKDLDGIHIFATDPEAANGGTTEPHVSNVLSARLSSRPMAWSKATLKKFVPILAAGCCMLHVQLPQVSPSVKQVQQRIFGRRLPLKYSLGLSDPDRAVTLPGRSGKVTPLYNALRCF